MFDFEGKNKHKTVLNNLEMQMSYDVIVILKFGHSI